MRIRASAAVLVSLLVLVPLSAASDANANIGPANVWVSAPAPETDDDGTIIMPMSAGVSAGASAGGHNAQASYYTDMPGDGNGGGGCGSECCGPSCDPCSSGCDPGPCSTCGDPVGGVIGIVNREVYHAVSNFAITYHNPAADVVTYETHGILNASIKCLGGWETVVSSAIIPIFGNDLTYNVWYSPAQLQIIDNRGGNAIITTASCEAPTYVPYSDAPLSGQNSGCSNIGSASPTPAKGTPQLGWIDNVTVGPKTVFNQDPDAGIPKEIDGGFRFARGRFCYGVAPMPNDPSQLASPAQGVPFTGTVFFGGLGTNCRTGSFIAGRLWEGVNFYATCSPGTYNPYAEQQVQLYATKFAVATMEGPFAGTYSAVLQGCDAQC